MPGGYDPNQPRDPAGTATGGQWTKAENAAREAAGVSIKQTIEIYRSPDGNWSEERQKLHQQIIAKHFEGVSPVENPTVIYMGGGGASGKSTMLKTGQIGNFDNYVKVDPDKIKYELPEMNELIAKGDRMAAATVHEESSYLAREIGKIASAKKYNVVFDGVADNTIEHLTKKVNEMRQAGQPVYAYYATCDFEKALKRSIERANKPGASAGRFVPFSSLMEGHRGVSETLPKALERGLFDHVELWDTNTEGKAIKIMTANGTNVTILDGDLWSRFLNKSTLSAKDVPDENY